MKCIRCGGEAFSGHKICCWCMDDWKEMRTRIFNALQDKYGMLSLITQGVFKRETKRLENLWRKDRDRFEVEIGKINSSNIKEI